MPEGVAPYPRWGGRLAATTRAWVIVEEEVRRTLRSPWGLAAVLLGAALGAVYLGNLYELRQRGVATHGLEDFITMMDALRWSALAVAAVVGATTLLEDKRRGALEIYFTRSLTPGEYLGGKAAAQLLMTTGVMFVPALVYFGASHLFFNQHPEHWAWMLPAALAYSLLWSLLVTGLALGLSAVGRSAAGATLTLLGAFVVLEMLLWRILSALTDNPAAAILSPMAAAQQFHVWLFRVDAPHDFPAWWGVAAWLALAAVGWLLLVWRRPRVHGREVGA